MRSGLDCNSSNKANWGEGGFAVTVAIRLSVGGVVVTAAIILSNEFGCNSTNIKNHNKLVLF